YGRDASRGHAEWWNLPHVYKAVQLHFRWGNNGGPGSEHTVEREQYPTETPDCSEAVIWTVIKHYIPLGEKQLAAFSSLKFRAGVPIVKTFRLVQPRRGRPVYRSFSSSAVAVGSLAPLLVSVCAALALSQSN
ncbi:hypothetical protein P4O66_016364, partial [Electrophorus voltai]